MDQGIGRNLREEYKDWLPVTCRRCWTPYYDKLSDGYSMYFYICGLKRLLWEEPI